MGLVYCVAPAGVIIINEGENAILQFGQLLKTIKNT